MFAAVLNQVTGYFDRRALLSTFFPTLAFTTVIVIALAASGRGISAAASSLSHQPGLVQAAATVGFLAAVTLLSVLVNNLRPVIDQAFQGDWPDQVLDMRPCTRMVARQQRRRTALVATDDALEDRVLSLEAELRALPAPSAAVSQTDQLTLAEVDQLLAGLQAALADGAESHLTGIGGKLTRLAGALSAETTAAAEPTAPTAERIERFSLVMLAARTALESAAEQVRERRARVHQQLFLLFPAHPAEVAGTRLGNIMRAAEQYPRVRYRMDPVVAWSRLQPLLPEEASSPLKDAKASIDTLLTSALYVAIAGMSGAIWTAFASARQDVHVLVPLLCAAAVACAAALLPGRRRKLTRLASALCPGILLVLPLTLTQSASLPRWLAVVARLDLAFLLAGGALAFALSLYHGACQAALSYAEQLRACFDLHRWRMLEQLHLPLPTNLTEERRTWAALMRFLYRGDVPDPTAFQYVEHQAADSPNQPA